MEPFEYARDAAQIHLLENIIGNVESGKYGFNTPDQFKRWKKTVLASQSFGERIALLHEADRFMRETKHAAEPVAEAPAKKFKMKFWKTN